MKSRISAGRTTAGLVAILLAVALSIGFMLVPAVASAGPSYPTLNENAYVTNGTVRAIVTIGTTTYIGGDFTQVVTVDGGTVQDRNHIAALNAAGTVTSWNPNADGIVRSLAVSGSTVYAGGDFTNIGGQARNRIAALNAGTNTNNATTWNPNADNTVYALAVSGSTVYAGGDFLNIGGSARNRIAALNATGTGAATAWNPDADDTVRALAVSGSTVYAGGDFLNIGGSARNRIAALNSTTGGVITTWNPNADFTVYALAVSVSGTTVYAGGDFTNIGGSARKRIAALNATGAGAATAWNPNADDSVYALAVSGTTVYAGGDFWNIGGKDRNNIAALDTTGAGAATAWNPSADNTVYALAVSDTAVYAGGYFTSIGGEADRRYFAQFNAGPSYPTLNENTWVTDGTVFAIVNYNGITYIGGYFTQVGPVGGPMQTRNRIAALDATGAVTTWNPSSDSTVYALAVSGTTVYAGGDFTNIGGSARNHIAALDADPVSPTYGQATAWNPDADDIVWALAVSDTTVYAGGDFTTFKGGTITRNYIAALDATGLPTTWDPDADNTVYALAVSGTGSTIYAGGDFTTFESSGDNPIIRNYIAALSSTGTVRAWNPDADNTVWALAVSDSTVYAGGDFSTFKGGTIERNGIAALDDTASGAATAWNPDADNTVYALAVSDSTVYAGGDFWNIGGEADRYYFAQFDFGDPNPAPTTTGLDPTSKTAGESGFTLTVNGNYFLVGTVVKWNNSDRTTTYVSGTQLKADIPTADIATTGTASVTVFNPSPGGGTSTPALTFTINNPVPSTTNLSPTSKVAGEGAFTLTVNGTNFVNGLSKVRWNGSDRTTTYVSATKLTAAIPASDIASAGTARITVFNPTPGGGTSNAQTFTVTAPPTAPPESPSPQLPSLYPTWYLAEGTTDWGYSEYITIENPNPTAVTAHVTYMTKNGPREKADMTLPASSQTTVNPRADLGATDFSTRVTCLDGKTIAVDRTMSWTGPGAASPEAHSSTGVTSPENTWYLPEGSTAWGFECWLVIQNPNTSEATCTVTYMTEGSPPQTSIKKVPASSRATFDMSKDIGSKDASIKVTSDIPVIPERAMYRNNRREGHESIGTTTPASDYFLAEGTTAWGFTTYVLVQNPNDTPANVTVTYMTGAGAQPQVPFSMPANSRKTIRVNDILPGTDLSTQVHADKPIIAERSMYWGAGTPLGEATHDSIGMASPHRTFYLPDGETSNGRETWTLVQNPNAEQVTVEITYMTPNGQGNVVKMETIPASSRRTFGMLEHSGINGRAAIMVQSTDPSKKIMVERAMYWNNRGAGTDTIGGYSD